MIRLAAAALFVLAAGAQDEPLHLAQTIVEQRIIVRVPSRPAGRGVAASSRATDWRESDGPRCLQADQIASANIAATSIDFILRDNRRVRAHLGRRCEALNYYRGFYLNRPPDGRICAGRDSIRSRMGGVCDIAEFRTLQPAVPRRARR